LGREIERLKTQKYKKPIQETRENNQERDPLRMIKEVEVKPGKQPPVLRSMKQP
jgi:hypothetical protein